MATCCAMQWKQHALVQCACTLTSSPPTVLLGAPMSARMMISDALTTLETVQWRGQGRRGDQGGELNRVCGSSSKFISGPTCERVLNVLFSVQHINLAGKNTPSPGMREIQCDEYVHCAVVETLDCILMLRTQFRVEGPTVTMSMSMFKNTYNLDMSLFMENENPALSKQRSFIHPSNDQFLSRNLVILHISHLEFRECLHGFIRN